MTQQIARWASITRTGIVKRPKLRWPKQTTFRLVCHSAEVSLAAGGSLGSVKWNTLPSPAWESTQIRPPCRSTITLHVASPTPDPGICSRE